MEEKEKCPNCKCELETGYLSDAYAGEVLVSLWFEYCPECLYRGDVEITNISK
jgi:C4-type Zn-finger protein